jgi:hypothetical protein
MHDVDPVPASRTSTDLAEYAHHISVDRMRWSPGLGGVLSSW